MASNNVEATRAIKPTEVGDASQQPNPDKTQVNKGGFAYRGCPRRGDRCGDRVKCALTTSFVLEKRFERTRREAPFLIFHGFPSSILPFSCFLILFVLLNFLPHQWAAVVSRSGTSRSMRLATSAPGFPSICYPQVHPALVPHDRPTPVLEQLPDRGWCFRRAPTRSSFPSPFLTACLLDRF